MDFLKGSKLLRQCLSQGPSVLSGVHDPLAIHDPLFNMLQEDTTNQKYLVILPDEDAVDTYITSLQSKFANLNSFGASPYSGLEPSSHISPGRLHFLHQSLNPDSKVRLFVSHPEALLLKTISKEELKKQTFTFEFADSFFEDPSKQLLKLGYLPSQFVERPGQFCDKGGIIDVFSPAHSVPHRIELFGNDIESIRTFSPDNQRTKEEASSLTILPANETLYTPDNKASLIGHFAKADSSNPWVKDSLHKIRNSIPFSEQEYYLPLFWKNSSTALDYFSENTQVIVFDETLARTTWSSQFNLFNAEHETSAGMERPSLLPTELFTETLPFDKFKNRVNICSVLVSDLASYNSSDEEQKDFNYSTSDIRPTLSNIKKNSTSWELFTKEVKQLLETWTQSKNSIYICCKSENTILRTSSILSELNLDFTVIDFEEAPTEPHIYVVHRRHSASVKYNDDNVIFLNFEDLFGKESRSQKKQKTGHKEYFDKLEALSMGDIEPEDLVVHIQHGVGVFKGLKILTLQGIDSECIEIQYDGKDKLFLPNHKIHQLRKYSGNASARSLDKLGGQYWQKTKSKVKSKLKEIAEDLIQLYALRKTIKRAPLNTTSNDVVLFQNQFPFQETKDQLEAIDSIYEDLQQDFPMERLVCGDVGFGKTEVAMRAAFVALAEGKQVAILAPTTVLSLQHLQSFKERFKYWPFEIKGLNRFISPSQVKETLVGLESGRVDLVVGTHRVLSQDVNFKNLGLLVIDEEQKFGVRQKEKIKKIKSNVDVLSLSATPIPRTLNMGFLGVRDLSLISTAPKNRLPIKTFVSHYNLQVIKKAIESEVKRGGQVYFVHNRVQSIYALHEELKELLPNVRIGLGHGQMPERELESVMVKFFSKEIDVLLSTTIIESGVDVSSANTIIINNAQNFGLSQLYQLRGRVGRSERRAFCYLLIPPNRELEKTQKEKLKVLQDHTALGSGLKIAHYDLELRGAGNLLGESQSGHAEAIGYEFYIELLEEAIAEVQGKDITEVVDPEISVPLPALIPSKYIGDLKTRLYYYRKLNRIDSEQELDDLEFELKDQFGPIPDEVIGLFFLSATKNICRKLGVKDLKAGPKNISLMFVQKPNINHDKLFALMKAHPKKYKLSPDQRILIAREKPEWNQIYEEISALERDLLS